MRSGWIPRESERDERDRTERDRTKRDRIKHTTKTNTNRLFWLLQEVDVPAWAVKLTRKFINLRHFLIFANPFTPSSISTSLTHTTQMLEAHKILGSHVHGQATAEARG